MSSLKLRWHRIRGRSCHSCHFADTFVSNGDGQVERLHTFCRAPHSGYFNRPAPPERICPHWQQAAESRDIPGGVDPNLTA